MATSGLAVRCFILPELDLLQHQGHEIIIISNPDHILEAEIKKRGVIYHPLPLKRNISLFNDFFTLLRLIKLFVKIKPDIVHTITPKAGLLGITAAKIAGIPKRVHDYVGMVQETRSGFSRYLLDFTDKITCRFASKIFANSHSLIKKMAAHKIASPEKINIINKGSSYGVDTVYFDRSTVSSTSIDELKKSISYLPSYRYVLFAGRLVRDKGIEELVEAFTKLNKKYNDVKMLLIGDFEPHLDAISEKAEKSILQHPSIQLIPWTDKIREYIYLADFLVLPTYREGFANILLEAGAMKCPIICSNATGNVDLIRNNENGLLFPVADAVSLYSKMEFALENPDVMKKMAATLHLEILKEYDLTKIIKLNLQKYD
jgi:glycosyltransferase involved in cell wall biosynthesis